jgi:hypothetical protein
MNSANAAVRLTASDYVVNGRDGLNQQVANARWQFLMAVQRIVPEFFERLRNDVYPTYARLADERPRYWHTRGTFSIWRSCSDRDRRLTPILMAWAREFNLERETWILEGALQTLSNWHKVPRLRESLDIRGFRKPVCVSVLISDRDHSFQFEDGGWDPTLISFAGWRANARERFEAAMKRHCQQMQTLIEQRGGVPAVVRSSAEHFEWLALYQCAHASLDSILTRAPYAGDKTTISKGMHQAAELAHLRIRAKRGKLKSH